MKEMEEMKLNNGAEFDEYENVFVAVEGGVVTKVATLKVLRFSVSCKACFQFHV